MPNDLDTSVESDFDQIVATDLRKIAVVPQCLDNQWVSQDLLAKILKRGSSLIDERVARRRIAGARAEYLRSLLNAEQVVINRAFFFNNPVVYGDFGRNDKARETFKEMLNTHVIVPYLLDERTPGELPAFSLDQIGLPAWRDLLPEVRPQCLRLSWDDVENAIYTKTYLYGRFSRFLSTLGALTPQGLATDLGLRPDDAAELLRRLKEVNMWAWDQEDVTRNQFYQRYVVRDGSQVADGFYDPGKPFAGELKQLADLRYMTNLPDALDRFPLAPGNSLHRTALQEERQIQPNRAPDDPNYLLSTLLRRKAFDLIQQPLSVSLTGLTLNHILQVRKTDEWHKYIADLGLLIGDPNQFDKYSAAVYWSYVNLATRLAQIVGAQRERRDWLPVMKVLIEFVGATLTVVYDDHPFVEAVGKVATDVAGVASTVVVRFVVASHDRHKSQRELGTGIEIMKLKFLNTGAAWQQLVSGFTASGLAVRTVDVDATVEDDPSMDVGSQEV